ncbi:putative ubiquitin-conjugating enzyme E2 25 [Rosa sericea]
MGIRAWDSFYEYGGFDNHSYTPKPTSSMMVPDENIPEPEPKLYGEIEEIQYEVETKFQEFKNFDILGYYPNDHHFVYRRGKPRIENEWEFIRVRLPPEPKLAGSIFVRVYDQRIDLMSVMIVGRESPPYHQGLFFFDIFFPSNYLKLPQQETEDVPPLFYHSFDFDLNPNLRKNGTVSLDKTQKCKNTLELLSSLKDLVVNDKSYIDAQKGMKLNRKVFMQTFEAMLKMLKRPPRPFKDFVLGYFRTRAHDILLNYKACADLEDNAMNLLFFKLVRSFEANGTYCRHHYNQKRYDRALKEEKELLNQSREKYGYEDFLYSPPKMSIVNKAKDWLYFGV